MSVLNRKRIREKKSSLWRKSRDGGSVRNASTWYRSLPVATTSVSLQCLVPRPTVLVGVYLLTCFRPACHCGFQFCYVCGEKWKTCRCPHFHEANLLNRADEFAADRRRVARNVIQPPPGGFVMPPVFMEARNVAPPGRAIACHHREVRRDLGEHRCNECNFVLRQFILHCLQCGLDVCYRCSGI